MMKDGTTTTTTASDSTKPSTAATPSDPYSDIVIETHQIGVFKMFLASDKKRASFGRYVTEFWTVDAQILYRLLSDMYRLSPLLFVLYFLSIFSTALHGAIEMSVASRVLRTIEIALNERIAAPVNIWWSLGLLVSWSALSQCISHYRMEITMQVRSRVENHFQVKIMRSDLRKDLPTSQDEAVKDTLTARSAWRGVEGLSHYLHGIISAGSQVVVVTRIATAAGGPLFLLACLVHPILILSQSKSAWEKVCFAFDSNEDHVRSRALESLVKDKYRQDVISGNLAEWIVPEYLKLRERLHGIPDDHPLYTYSKKKQLPMEVLGKIVENIPLIYSVVSVMLDPSRITLSGVAIMRSSATSLQYAFGSLIGKEAEIKKTLSDLRTLYTMEEITNVMEDGKIEYPHEKSSPNGMCFELKDVSFSYSSSEKKEESLKSVSLSVPSGSVVVIVGSNGSGKSTLIRLLSRLYDPTSGTILIDNRPSTSYRMTSLRESSVLLCQDHNVFPLSFTENIGLGCPPLLGDMDLVRQSAEKGGARGFIEKLEHGFETILDPRIAVVANKLEHHPHHPLQAEKKKVKTRSDISGGERQRIVASRAFMRMHSNKIRFVAVDEPTSALDSEGEFQLFTRLLEAREGKTMIFVTHRFGYLTKHADTIVCMKDGVIEEVGKHSELIKKENGEYAKLYNIQANAFLADT